MTLANEKLPQAGLWTEYRPDTNDPWDFRRVLHLHRRAAFAPTWTEISRDLADGPRASIDRLLAGKARSEGVFAGFETTADLLADQALAVDTAGRLKAWWTYRMLFGPDPLAERLTLFWHNYFATSNLKVRDLRAMRRQNDIFRQLGRGRFGVLLNTVVRDPALLVWLDAPANRKEHPNENLARELMELFTLGIGHYTETDVKEAARALSGWSLTEEGAFCEKPERHDGGEKIVLGRKGRWKGDDLVGLLLSHPATAGHLAERICEWLLGEGVASADAIASLAAGLRARDLDVGWAIETVLRSRRFFSATSLGARVVGPVEFVINATRALELFDPAPSTLVIAEWAARLGQDLFFPPNVGGWPGGRAWITTQSAMGRANFAAALIDGVKVNRPPFDALGLARKHGRAHTDAGLGFFAELLLGVKPRADYLRKLQGILGVKAPTQDESARRAVAVLLASPEGQLC
jgi:uncharacterized protein (DUF1800 family)